MKRRGKVYATEDFLSSKASQTLFSVFRQEWRIALPDGIFEIEGTSPLFDLVADNEDTPSYTAQFDNRAGIQFKRGEENLKTWQQPDV